MRLDLPSGHVLKANFETFDLEENPTKTKFKAKHLQEFDVFVVDGNDSGVEVASLTGHIIDFAKIFDDFGMGGLSDVFKFSPVLESFGEAFFQKKAGRITPSEILPALLKLFGTNTVNKLKVVLIDDFYSHSTGDTAVASKLLALKTLKASIGKRHAIFSDCLSQSYAHFGEADRVSDDAVVAQTHRLKEAYKAYGFSRYGSPDLVMCWAGDLPEADHDKVSQHR